MNTHEIVLAIRDRRGFTKSRKRAMRTLAAALADYYSLDAQKMRREKEKQNVKKHTRPTMPR